jgi:fructan beta-fructosidase
MSYDHKLRPQFHFTPQANWMNDPNGCVYHKGTYHLFFQYHPEGTKWGPMHWGHAISQDLIYWEEKEIALYPDKELGMIFSGSAIIDRKNCSGLFPQGEGMILFYTSHKEVSNEILQQQCIAYSHNDGQTIEKFPKNPVISNPGIPDFRDPKVVFHPGSASWIMVIAAGRQIDLYSSRDLLNWSLEKPFLLDTSPLDGIWECPDFFPLPHPLDPKHKVWIMTLSLQQSTQHPTQIYLSGDFNGHEFIPHKRDSYHFADYGMDFYAAQSWSNTEGEQTTWIGWCNNWNYAAKTPETELWRGAMSIPRKLKLIADKDELILVQKPVTMINKLRKNGRSFSQKSIQSITSFNLDKSDLWDIEINQIFPSTENNTEILFYWETGDTLILTISAKELILDRSHCGSLFKEGYWNRIAAPLSSSGTLKDCRILLDRGIIEIFLEDGRTCMTNQIFPEGKLMKMEVSPAKRIDDIWGFDLKSIWDGI